MSLISLLVILIIFCVVIWAAKRLMVAFGVGDPIASVIYVILVLVMVLWAIQQLGFIGRLDLR